MSRSELVDAYVSGRMSRRVFIKRLVKTGVTVASAVTFAGVLTPSSAHEDPHHPHHHYPGHHHYPPPHHNPPHDPHHNPPHHDPHATAHTTMQRVNDVLGRFLK